VNVERLQPSGEQQVKAPLWRTDQSKKCPLCPLCKHGWCDLNTDNYLECPECHVQFKDTTGADPNMRPLEALKPEAAPLFRELPTYTNDDGTRYDGTVYASCGYTLVPRLDTVEVVPVPGMPDFITQHKRRAPDDPLRKMPLLGRGHFR
jgi:hypothetical protein